MLRVGSTVYALSPNSHEYLERGILDITTMPLQEVKAGDDRVLQDIADVLVKSHKVVLITGAGISTSCGIPVSYSMVCSCLHRRLTEAGLSIKGRTV